MVLVKLISALLLAIQPLFALDTTPSVEEQTATKAFVIAGSYKEYGDALKKAQLAAEKMGYPLKLNGLSPHPKTGLTHTKEFCEAEEGGISEEYPCYWPRGRWDDGKYVSIEYSSAFTHFSPNYYIVVVANDNIDSPDIRDALKLAKSKGFKDAYAKTDKVYLGCMH